MSQSATVKAEKKARNEAAAALRLKNLQARQKAENEARKARILASNPLVKAQAEEQKRRAEEVARQVQERQRQLESEFVSKALAGEHGLVLRRWLATRIPTFERVSRFFAERPKLNPPQVGLTKAA